MKRRNDFISPMREDLAVRVTKNLPVFRVWLPKNHHATSHIDHPVIGNARRGIETRFRVRVRFQRAIAHFNNKQCLSRMVLQIIARRTDDNRQIGMWLGDGSELEWKLNANIESNSEYLFECFERKTQVVYTLHEAVS